MPTYMGGRKVKEMWYGGRKIKEAWYGGKKVYSSGVPVGTVVTQQLTFTIGEAGKLEAPPRGVWRMRLTDVDSVAGDYPVTIIIGGEEAKLYPGKTIEATFYTSDPFYYRYVAFATLEMTKIREA